MTESLAVILTCHERKAITMRCLGCLARQNLPEDLVAKVFLVDDGSTDGTAVAVREAYPGVAILSGDGRLYWSGGMRRAFCEAMKNKYDFYLWLNDDVKLSVDAVALMVTTYRKLCQEGYCKSIVVGSTRDPQTGELTYGGFRKGPWFRPPLHYIRVIPGKTPAQCDAMNGNCVLIPDEVAQIVGNIDAVFTHALGDIDYALRAQRKGCAIWVAPGYVGACARNSTVGNWNNPNLSFADRIKKVRDPKRGLPFHEWKVFLRRHGGILWPFFWIYSYRKLFQVSWKK